MHIPVVLNCCILLVSTGIDIGLDINVSYTICVDDSHSVWKTELLLIAKYNQYNSPQMLPVVLNCCILLVSTGIDIGLDINVSYTICVDDSHSVWKTKLFSNS